MRHIIYSLIFISTIFPNFAFSQNNMVIHQGNGTKIILPLQSIDSVRYQLTPPPVLQKIYQNNGNILSVSVSDIDSITFFTPNVNTLAVLSTQSVSILSNSLATGGGTVVSDGGSSVIQRGICWSTSPNPTIANNFTIDGNGLGAFSSTMTPLLPSTTYYARAYATNSNGTAYGNQVIFITSAASNLGLLPTITTNQVIYQDSLSALCGGNITADGGLAVTSKGVCWAIGTTPTINNIHTIDGAGGGAFNSRAFNLMPNTTYFIRAYATNAAGTAYGITYSFTTKGYATVKTDSVSTIWATYAKVHGNVVSDGGSTVSDRGICWSTSPNPTIANNKVSPYAWNLNTYYSFASTLPPNTIIYFRAFAGNGIGYAYGNEISVKTKNGIPTVIADSITNIRALEALINSRIINDGGDQIIQRGVCWNTNPNPTINDSITLDGGQFNSFISNPRNLSPNTTYYVRSYAKTNIGNGYSNQLSFKTRDGISLINLDSIFNIRAFDAASSSNIINDGGAPILNRGVCWSLLPSPTINDNKTNDGTSIGMVNSFITSLLPDTTYYLRAYSTTIAGISYSSEISFKTKYTVYCASVPTLVVDVINPITGKTWMDRNLGAERKAQNDADYLSIGDLYQWGRRTDGHQCRNSAEIFISSSLDQPQHGSFILNGSDWRNPQNNTLWQGVNGINNPCPNNYRLPTSQELDQERLSWMNNSGWGAFQSPLKLTMAGFRNGAISGVGSSGKYWSSTLDGNSAFFLDFIPIHHTMFSLKAKIWSQSRADGASVRCIKNDGSIQNLNCSSALNIGSLIGDSNADSVSSIISYSGGTKGAHPGQTISSSGVTGLTAKLVHGNISDGNGTLTYTISGFPSYGGTAYFDINIGGKTCVLSRNVDTPSVKITSLNCNNIINIGRLDSGFNATNCIIKIPYTGGNGGKYNSQVVQSSGVTGLTATLYPGIVSFDTGYLNLIITGIPSQGGDTAYFSFTINGKSCLLKRYVYSSGKISNLNCNSSINLGKIDSGIQVVNASSKIFYTGGNGGKFNSQNFPSYGILGLTANLDSGYLSADTGSLIFNITGTPFGTGDTAYFNINIGGQSCVLKRFDISYYQYPIGTIICNTISRVKNDITNPITGRIWMDRNLGASRAALSSNDSLAFGDLYQWGRRADGHQCRNSDTTSAFSSIDQPTHSKFILSAVSPFDWRIPQNNSLWQGVNGVNNPCPNGYRIPSEIECNSEAYTWSSYNAMGAFNSNLKLTLAGFRRRENGLVVTNWNQGMYHTSTINGTNIKFFVFSNSSSSLFLTENRSWGASVRCIKDILNTQDSISSLNCDSVIVNGILKANTSSNGVTFNIFYESGTGTYNGQSIASTGVVGLIAILSPSNLQSIGGTLTYNVYGTPNSSGIAYFNVSIGGKSCQVKLEVYSQSTFPTNSIFCGNTTKVLDVVNPSTGRTWMDRNLGSSRAALSSNDSLAFGDLYQWGRRADGHQCINSLTINVLSSIDQPSHNKFIIVPTIMPYDWRSPQNSSLWQGVSGINNPCPSGYRIPTVIEFDNEKTSWTSDDLSGAFNSPLKLPRTLTRSGINGSVSNSNTASYWTSIIRNSFSDRIFINGSYTIYGNDPHSNGFGVRCIKN